LQLIDNPELMQSATNYDFITDNFVRVNVYLSDMEVEIQEQQPSYLLSNLFSDVGGTLGLWVGLSLLTVVELLQLVARLGLVLIGASVD
jgi:acid-sensing ion channel 2